MNTLSADSDTDWQQWKAQWKLRANTVYLNHGSFGPPPLVVQNERQRWRDQLDSQPMDFFVRQFSGALSDSRQQLARFVGTTTDNVVYTENATAAMNIVADSLPLTADDEVLLTNHEYAAVHRIWQRACRRAGAGGPNTVQLPLPFGSPEDIVDRIARALTPRTRLLVVSHITSPTATILPVLEICRKAKELGVAVCIDGPHAPAQLPVQLDTLPCDFYTASLHKWLSAPFGSGFLYVHPARQDIIQPPVLSYGVLPPDQPSRWHEEFGWLGTRDPSAYLSVPAAIQFFEAVGPEAFRARTHWLAQYARQRLIELTGLPPITPDSTEWYGSMALAELPSGDCIPLQTSLWQQHSIEVPIVEFEGRRFIRVSCHLYNSRGDIDQLIAGLDSLLGKESGR